MWGAHVSLTEHESELTYRENGAPGIALEAVNCIVYHKCATHLIYKNSYFQKAADDVTRGFLI